ncbi:hypothetical protein, partial [Paenibacillus antarcticus]|uniref:hypothetical protein n=1 Tax=Paenibacillus antarcticus TaxID=253703 RepID=UPI000AB440F0
MELLQDDAPIDNLFDGDKTKILLIYDNAISKRLTKKDIGDLFRITQQNCSSFTSFQISLILRVAE